VTTEQPPAPRRRIEPLLVVIGLVAVGLVISALHHPQLGIWIVCGSLAAAALLRLVLRERDAGLLVVRARRVDVVVLATLATALGVLAAVTPFPTGKG
jgi:hypothetical protein